MTYTDILYEKKDGVAWITINRPEVRNAFRTRTVRELTEAFEDAKFDRTIGVVVLTGAGDKAFCAGADLKGVGDRGTTLQARESFSGLPRILEAMARMRTLATC